MKKTIWHSEYFCGNRISLYGLENGYVDYGTLAKSFDLVLANGIVGRTVELGEWELFNGSDEYYEDSDGNRYDYDELQEKIDELQEAQEALDEESDEYRELQEKIDELQALDPYYYEYYQEYIISENGAKILADYTGETVWYNDELGLYVWGVTHWGTGWNYVLTDIKIDLTGKETY